MRPCLARLLIALLLAAALAGCTRIGLAYRNLDLLIPWTLDDYLQLDGAQRRQLAAHLDQHLAWHCRSQLPRYVEQLAQLRRQLDDERLAARDLQPTHAQLRLALRALGERITPSAVTLLRELDDSQVQHLRAAFAERQEADAERYLQAPLAQQVRQRADRASERLEHWFGPLDAAQRQRVLAWSHSLGEQNRHWLDGRGQWQAAMLAALAQREQVDFPARLAGLLQDRESAMSSEVRQASRQAEQATVALLADLHTLAGAEQRRHLQQRLAALQRDLSELQCS